MEYGILSYAVGYQYRPNISLWLGYQWDSQNQITGFDYQNRLWMPQIIWNPIKNEKYFLSTRNRLEIRFQEGKPHTNYRLRERLFFKTNKTKSGSVNPLTWDELFINFNNPSWVNRDTINQNRFFMGIEVVHKNQNIEIGYMNQYILGNIQDTMSHAFFINFNVHV